MSFLLKIYYAPRRITTQIVDSFWAPFVARLHGVEMAEGVRLRGVPSIRPKPNGRIRLGRNVKLLSYARSNPLTLTQPCCLSLLEAGALIEIGAETFCSGVVICAAQSVTIGERVLIGANVRIVDTDFHPLSPEMRRIDPNQGAKCKPIVIGNDVFIGAHAILLKGTVLGDGCVVGAGAVVSGEFPPRSIVVGNPAQTIRTLSE
jgi:acetyltransferase-like isoleucine patch superfamily enzyme